MNVGNMDKAVFYGKYRGRVTDIRDLHGHILRYKSVYRQVVLLS